MSVARIILNFVAFFCVLINFKESFFLTVYAKEGHISVLEFRGGTYAKTMLFPQTLTKAPASITNTDLPTKIFSISNISFIKSREIILVFTRADKVSEFWVFYS